MSLDWAQSVFSKITAYFIEHRDGFRTAMFLIGIRDFNYAGHRSDTGEIISCQMYLPMPTHGSSTADFFNPLTRHIDDLIINERANYPVERTLLTSGMVVAGVDSLFQNQIVIPTPQMDVTYQVSEESTFWRI